jgi:hypothetical protein
VVSLAGADIAAAPGLGYALAVSQQRAGRDPANLATRTERGIAATAHYTLDLGETTTLLPIVEVVRLDNAGNIDEQRTYATVGIELDWRQWVATAARTDRRIDGKGGAPDFGDRLNAASLGYKWDFGVETHLGWRHSREAGLVQESVGLLVGYNYRF